MLVMSFESQKSPLQPISGLEEQSPSTLGQSQVFGGWEVGVETDLCLLLSAKFCTLVYAYPQVQQSPKLDYVY